MADLGSDIGGVWDVSPDLAVSTGRKALAEAILRRLITPLGGLIGSPSYGYDVTALIGSTVPASVVEQRVRAQCLAEQEVRDASVNVSSLMNGTLFIAISITDDEGPFELTLQVGQPLDVRAFLNGELFAANDTDAA